MVYKKIVLKSRKKFLLFITLFVMCLIAVLFASHVYGSTERDYRTITIQKGDTLWDIAESGNNGQDIRKIIFEIKKLNNLDTSMIFEGQILNIPEY